MKNINRNRRLRRKLRVSVNIFGTKDRPRISVFRSNRYIYAQAIDDEKGMTLVSSSSLSLRKNKKIDKKIKKTDEAKIVGLDLGEKLKNLGIEQAVFDRGWYHYHGRVAALAMGLRESGIKI